MKTTVIRSQTVEDAKAIYGKDAVNEVFERIQKNSPETVLSELVDQNVRACLLYIFSGNIS